MKVERLRRSHSTVFVFGHSSTQPPLTDTFCPHSTNIHHSSTPRLLISQLQMSSPITSSQGLFFLSHRHPSRPMPFISVSPTITTSQPSSPHELRHIISAGALTPPQKDSVRERKLSAHASQHQHLGLRVGSRSPTSIPSSPTSV